jgi:hypothetical protein
MQRIPFDPFGQIFLWSRFLSMPLYYVNLVLHFFFFWVGHCLTFLASLNRSEPLHAFGAFEKLPYRARLD